MKKNNNRNWRRPRKRKQAETLNMIFNNGLIHVHVDVYLKSSAKGESEVLGKKGEKHALTTYSP